MGKKNRGYEEVLLGKKIPVLTLDNKWYKLFPNLSDYPDIEKKVAELNKLIKRQGKLNTEAKEIKKLKKRLMEELVLIVDENRQSPSDAGEKKIEEHKRLIAECNEKFEVYQEELMELPRLIDEVNRELMIFTMDYCYDSMQENTREIVEIAKWITEVRVELKKNLIRKQEKEIYNHQMYSYLHDIFGPEVIELFDLKYDPSKQVPQKKKPKPDKEKDKKIIIKDEEGTVS